MKLFWGILVICCLSSSAVSASPLLQVKHGQTNVRLSDQFRAALGDCDMGGIQPAKIKNNGWRLEFKAVGGALDPNDLIGEVNYNGGITFSCRSIGIEPEIAIQNFSLNLLGGAPVITAIVTVDGAVEGEGRFPIMIPGGEELELKKSDEEGYIKLLRADLSLTPDAISLLSRVLGISVEEAAYLGRSWSKIKLRKPRYHEYEDEDEDEDKSDNEWKGVIGNTEADSFALLTEGGERCVNYDGETRFYLDEDDSVSMETDSSSLVSGYKAEVYGEENGEGCIVADKVIVEDEEDED